VGVGHAFGGALAHRLQAWQAFEDFSAAVVDDCKHAAFGVDLIQHTNYSIPTLQYGSRVLTQRDRNVALGAAYEFTEADYVDGYEPDEYTLPDVEFNATLSIEQVARLHKINELLRRFVNGHSVSEKQLKSVLDAEQYSEYINALTTQKHLSEIDYGDGMPDVLRSYQ
jgi:hypothetical protein